MHLNIFPESVCKNTTEEKTCSQKYFKCRAFNKPNECDGGQKWEFSQGVRLFAGPVVGLFPMAGLSPRNKHSPEKISS